MKQLAKLISLPLESFFKQHIEYFLGDLYYNAVTHSSGCQEPFLTFVLIANQSNFPKHPALLELIYFALNHHAVIC